METVHDNHGQVFAVLKDKMGRDGDEVTYTDGITVADIWDQVSTDLDDNTAYMSALNMEYCSEDTAVSDGAEVAFFPKVSGG